MEYLERLSEKVIEKKLKSSGAVMIAGPKFCGKTTTSIRFAKSVVKLNTKNSIKNASLDTKRVLIGDKPRLIDEWQVVPDIFNQVKDDLDNEYVFGKYILTGSSTPEDKSEIYHTGAGRIVKVVMKPMSLYESKESKGIISLQDLFDQKDINVFDENKEWTLEDVAFCLCRGGWPLSVISDKEVALDVTKNYYGNIFNFEDIGNEKFRNKKREYFSMILKSYARNISTEASSKSIMQDVRQQEERTLDIKTFNDYKEALEDLYIIEDIDSYSPNLRSKTSIRQTPTRHFVDTSIACMALNISPKDLIDDLKSFGLFFEDMAIRDLKIYVSQLDGEIKHYRDNAGLECDAVIKLADGRIGLVEIKLGGEELINKGADSLIRFRSKLINQTSIKEPAFLMVLTAVGAFYKRKDGVYVVPINMLR